jgi:hypothetical protein
MDLSGAYSCNPTTYIFSDCSGEHYSPLSNSNVPESNPAPYELYVDSTMIELRRRNVNHNTNLNTNINQNPVFESAVEQTAEDDENENDDDDDDVSQEQVNQVRTYLQARSPWITQEQVLVFSIRLVNLVWGVLFSTYQVTKKVTWNVYSGFQPETYYFFKDSPHPWDASRINLSRAGSPRVDWFYNADTKTFSRSENDGHLHHFPYLTAEIYHGNLALYDITSFTEALKWTGGEVAPSANHVLSVLSLETGILLDSSLPLVLKIITQEGDESIIPLHIPTTAQVAAAST